MSSAPPLSEEEIKLLMCSLEHADRHFSAGKVERHSPPDAEDSKENWVRIHDEIRTIKKFVKHKIHEEASSSWGKAVTIVHASCEEVSRDELIFGDHH